MKMSEAIHDSGTLPKVQWVMTLLASVFLLLPLQVETAPLYSYFFPCFFSFCCTSRQVPTSVTINLNLPRTTWYDIVDISIFGGSFLGETDNLKDNICRWRERYPTRQQMFWEVSGGCYRSSARRLSAKVVISNPSQEGLYIFYSTRRRNSTEGLVIPLGSIGCSVPPKKGCEPCLTSRPYMAVVTDGSRTTCQSAPTFTLNKTQQYIYPYCSEFRPSLLCRTCPAPPSDDDLDRD